MSRYPCTFNDIPTILIEPFILRGYRSLHQPWSYYWRSLFHKHNETINVWSHLIGILHMGYLLYYYNQRLLFYENSHSWPFAVSLCTAIIMFICSAFAHLLHSKSEIIHRTCFAIDYVGVSLHGFGSGFLHIYYSAPQWYYDKIEYQYVFMLLLLSIFACFLNCFAQYYFHPPYPPLKRICQFLPCGILWIYSVIPLIIGLLSCQFPSDLNSICHLGQVILFLIGATLFAFDLPQRFWPGALDFIGQSHHLFHLCIYFVTVCQMHGVYWDYEKNQKIIDQRSKPDLIFCVGSMISLILLDIIIVWYFRRRLLIYSDRHDYDAYGIRIASTDYFVVLAQNDGLRYVVSMAPFGMEYVCGYNYNSSNDFVISIAVGRRQNFSQLSFVYLRTNSTNGQYQKLGLFTFSRRNSTTSSSNYSCNQRLSRNEGEHDVKIWKREPSELSTLQVDLYGKYAYGFLSQDIFIYDIENNYVKSLLWNDIFPSINIKPHALDISETNDEFSIAIIAGYYEIDIEKNLPSVYLVRLNPPYNMTLVDNYTLFSDNQKFVRGRYVFTYEFDYVMSVSIHDATQQVLIGVPQLRKTYLFSFNSTNLTLINTFNHSARSTSWLDDDGIQAGLLLSDQATLPWAKSRIHVVNTTSEDILYCYPNNQQTLEQWSNTPPTFIRLTKTYDHQLVILTGDGTLVLIPSVDAGYYMKTDDINSVLQHPLACPRGTYKSMRGPTPCTICPTMTKSSPISVSFNSSHGMYVGYPTIECINCSSNSFCPLASVNDVNQSIFQSKSQAYAYPTSSSMASFDDILMENTFSLEIRSIRCLLISPFFWSLITLFLAFIILLIMGILYHSPTGKKHFERLEWLLRHSDLIGNGELWFGGLISFAIIILIIYSFWFGTVFVVKYPLETSNDSYFVCDTSLKNTQFSSALQLLAIIKSNEETPIFDMLDMQEFTITVNFVQTGYTCNDVTAQENIGTYSVALPRTNCTVQSDNTTLTVVYRVPYHKMTIQINLTGSYYIGGIFICLTGPRTTTNDSSYIVQNLDYCQLFNTSDQTLGHTTEINFALTKMINRTESLDYSGSTNYSGIWIPTSTHGSLNDRLVYLQQGAFLRYLSTQHTLIISFSETEFYVINKQEPIARMGEVLFHDILFVTTIIGIFALAFLIFKLMFMPILKWIINHKNYTYQILYAIHHLHRPLFRDECGIEQFLLIFRLLSAPSVVEWPNIANCLRYQISFPNFPFNSIELSQLPMSMTIFSLIIFHFIHVTTLSSECESTTTIWTYYPCSFIISSSSSSFYCQQASISLSIDQYIDREITFFWHFPYGNMTITLKSDKNQSFLLHLFKMSSLKKKLIKNIYHLVNNKTINEQKLNIDEHEVIIIPSNEYNHCSIKFETSNRIIFDYGILIRMSIRTNDNNIH
ncbi:unnamed protein product [Rotaria sordida]|uniref:Uncharacterized protein n=1 Tax=Rotaria sordida TaxID=392033 RepID=A0A814PEK2_9BILA|nr:unnamed protein product [Rotaria sordida]